MILTALLAVLTVRGYHACHKQNFYANFPSHAPIRFHDEIQMWAVRHTWWQNNQWHDKDVSKGEIR